MLTKISIQGFKSIYDISELELGLVNVFIGANGSGKSNLLEAVGVLGAAIEESVEAKSLLERGVRYGNPALFKASLKDVIDKPLIQFNAQVQHKEVWHGYELHLNNSIENPSERWIYEMEKTWQGEEEWLSRTRNEARLRFPNASGFRMQNIKHDSSMAGYSLRTLHPRHLCYVAFSRIYINGILWGFLVVDWLKQSKNFSLLKTGMGYWEQWTWMKYLIC